VRVVLRWPDRRLRTPAAPVAEIDDGVRALWDEMIEVMEAMPGVGLAAPQLGDMRALAVVGLGAIGAIMPVLPTTPFVILAAFAFGRSSPRLAGWLGNSRPFGPILDDWRRHGAIRPRFKVMALIMVLGVLAVSLALGARPLLLLVQTVCVTAAAAFILSRPNGPGSPT